MTAPWSDWVGREEASEEVIAAEPAIRLAALLGRKAPGDTLPPLWHWLHHLDAPQPDQVGSDGHVARGLFLPPIPALRRMFAGGEVTVHRPLRIGAATRQTRRIAAIQTKTGSAGPLHVVTVEVTTQADGRTAIEEVRQFLYLDAPGGPRPATTDHAPLPGSVNGRDVLATDAALLMRFSALTYNGHRIHYDADYARGTEGYPERVVHGPLQAIHLAAVAEDRLGRPPVRLIHRSLAPAFCGERLVADAAPHGGGLRLHAHAPDGQRTARLDAYSTPDGEVR